MKEKIKSELTKKFEGVSDSILDRIAAKAAKTVKTEEEVATYIEGAKIQDILDAYGDSRATEATKTAVTNYEKKHGLKDGKPAVAKKDNEDEPDNSEPEDGISKALKGILETNKLLMERLDRLEGDGIANRRKQQLDSLLEEMPESVKAQYSKNFARMSFKDEEDFAHYIEEITPDIEGMKADFKVKASVVTPPKGGTGQSSKGVNETLKSMVDAAKASTGGAAPILGLPAAK